MELVSLTGLDGVFDVVRAVAVMIHANFGHGMTDLLSKRCQVDVKHFLTYSELTISLTGIFHCLGITTRVGGVPLAFTIKNKGYEN